MVGHIFIAFNGLHNLEEHSDKLLRLLVVFGLVEQLTLSSLIHLLKIVERLKRAHWQGLGG